MTYTLYSHDGSGGFAVEAALVKAGAPYETVTVDTAKGEQNRPEFVAINPMRQVPTLKMPDGSVMTESAAIVVHLADAFPEQGPGAEAGNAGARAVPALDALHGRQHLRGRPALFL